MLLINISFKISFSFLQTKQSLDQLTLKNDELNDGRNNVVALFQKTTISSVSKKLKLSFG